ncbi:Lysophospholipase [Mycena indigotica]|uniref:Lysophospholipase n=1 Tax=Mycena indigotica TaxID=2126181 RepID=A0A8H6SMS2_9AGAR|nr:Lysophospholipase [Mycena indigotica]KAF7301898.1 Lysophospholipase [Mycena indigotica]
MWRTEPCLRFASTMAPFFVFFISAVAAVATTGPVTQRCPPSFNLVRHGQSISASESHYIEQRREKVLPGAFKTYLDNVKRTGVALPKYVEHILKTKSQLPTIGISISGGGYRAAIFGAGVLNAFDSRNSSSVKKGTGGLLQAATHLAGLSGGSWLVTSLAQANFPTIQHLVFGDGQQFGGWLPEFNVWVPTGDPVQQAVFSQQLFQEIAAKAKHFPVSVGDVWGRALARHFSNGTSFTDFLANTTHGSGILFSDLIRLPSFASHQQPLPLMVFNLDSKHINGSIFPGGNFIPLNSPMFEANLFEFGSYDEVLAAHTPLKYLGTTNRSLCVTGFDEAMFLSGASSNLWNEVNITAEILAANTANFSILVNQTFPQSPNLRLDTSNFPNPFHNIAPKTFADSGETILALCDGGLDGQVTPYQPMLVKDRKVDVVIGVDSSNDANGYAFGASLIATQTRMKIFPRGLATFPSVPSSVDVLTTEKLATRPTFFGCTPSKPSHRTPTGPILVYLANGAPPRDGSPPLTNTSTFQPTYTADEVQGMLAQTLTITTQGAPVGNSLEDPEWPACLACAVVDRAREREGVKRDGICETCFARYCWRGE